MVSVRVGGFHRPMKCRGICLSIIMCVSMGVVCVGFFLFCTNESEALNRKFVI